MEVIKKYHISRVLVIALVIVSLVAYSCYTAPKAHAEAFTLTSLFLMLVMSVMASLGVTLLSDVLQSGIDYLHTQYTNFVATKGFSNIEDYLVSSGITSSVKLATPIFGAISIGKTVYDMIAEFCTWFFSENDVVSNGDTVGQLPTSTSVSSVSSNASSLVGTSSLSYSSNSVSFSCSSWRKTISYTSAGVGALITISSPLVSGENSFTLTRSITNAFSGSIPTVALGIRGVDGTYYTGQNASFDSNGVASVTLNTTYNSNAVGSTTLILWFYASYSNASTGSMDVGVSQIVIPSSSYFTVTPSSDVISPPSVSVGQTYSVPATGVTSYDSVEDAINSAVQPLTTSAGLSTTATVSGTAVPAEWVWLYEGVDSIKQNTSDDRHGTDFIPSNATIDFGFWHYVPDWISSVGAGFSMLVGVVTSLPSIMLAPLYGILVLGIVVALFHKLWGS